MREKNIFLVSLLVLGFLASCFGPFNKEEENKDVENLILLEIASKEFLEINGTWKDNYNTQHQIFAEKSLSTGTNGYWNTSSNFGNSERTIVEFDTILKTLYVKTSNEPGYADCNGNGTKGETGVKCYSRMVWTNYNNKYYYCEIVFNKATLEEAKNDPATANSSDPDNSGCGGFPWTRFEEQLE